MGLSGTLATVGKDPFPVPGLSTWHVRVKSISLAEVSVVNVNRAVPQEIEHPVSIEKFVFVVTYGRSGSTLIQKLLNAMAGACVRGENSNALMPLARAWHTVRTSPDLRRVQRRREPTTPDLPWYGGECVKADRYGRSLAQAFTRDILCPPPGTRIAGFKEIRWTRDPEGFPIALDFAYSCFPNAHFVFNTRDHAAVCRSGWWADQDPEQVLKGLARSETLFDAHLARHPERGIKLHYDDYVRDHDALRALYAYLDEPFDPDAVRTVMDTRLTHMQRNDPA